MQAFYFKGRSCDGLPSAAELDCLEGNFHMDLHPCISISRLAFGGCLCRSRFIQQGSLLASILPCGQSMQQLAFSGRSFCLCHLQGRDTKAKKPEAYIFDLKSERFAKELEAAVNVSPSFQLALHQGHSVPCRHTGRLCGAYPQKK